MRDKLTKINDRNYGIDALRILSMLMVVMLHVLKHGGIIDSVTIGTAKYSLIWFLEIFSYCAVNCYALVSGYVGVMSKYKYSNIAVLWLRVLFYTVSITFILKLINPESVGKEDFILAFFPVLSRRYWYFTSYFLMFFFVPFLNAAFSVLNRKKLKALIAIIIALVCCTSPFIFYDDPFKMNGGFSTLWLIVLYILGGYIRKYGVFQNVKQGFFLVMHLVFVTVTLGSKIFLQIITRQIFNEIRYDDIFVSYTSITVVGSAVCLLLLFERLSFHGFSVRVISLLAPLAFSVYLISDNELIVQQFLYNRLIWICKLEFYQMIPIIMGIVIGIYCFCSAIDLLRHVLFKLLRIKERLYKMEQRLLNSEL